MKVRGRRWTSALLATALMMTLLPGAARAETSDAAGGTGAAAAGSQKTAEGYSGYHARYASLAYGERIPFDLPAATRSDGCEAENGYLDTEDSLGLAEGAKATWTVKVPADALYAIDLTYAGQTGNRRDGALTVLVDGQAPYAEAREIPLTRLWTNATDIQQDSRGNDLIPKQEEVLRWQTVQLHDYALFTNDPLLVYLPAGTHTVTLENSGETLHLAAAALTPPVTVPATKTVEAAYREAGYTAPAGYSLKIQGEDAVLKSGQSLYPMYDRNSPATEPYDVAVIKRNCIGQANWATPGQWIAYDVDDIPADGLYYLTIKYRQNLRIGSSTFRSIYVNGEIPAAAMENVMFPYGVDWENQTIVDENGDPCPLYLKKGHNEIRFEVSVGKFADVLESVQQVTDNLNDMYIQIVMITGTSPDKYRDYYLEKEIPDLIETFTAERQHLIVAADRYDTINGEKATESETIRRAADQLASMLAKPASIPQRISNFRDTISNLSSFVYDNLDQPLEIDYFLIHSADTVIPPAKAGLWANIKHVVASFLASFTADYDNIGGVSTDHKALTVWMNSGRDQVQVLKDLTTDRFTPQTGIPVNLSIMQTGFIEATLAGTGPDVALGVFRGQPVNLACRGALADLGQFEGYDEVIGRFADTALVPYQYSGGTYALPDKQSYFMLFYRQDILDKLGLSVPQTWQELLQIVPRLQKNHMSVGLPYTIISAATAVDYGLGTKDLFPVLLLQNGGTVYADGGRRTALDSDAAMAAFQQWCDYYTQYGFDLAWDFYTRFRNGETPIAVADFDLVYGYLVAGAPEIRGKWGMSPIPGTKKADGSIDRSAGGAGRAIVMFENAQDKDAAWSFIDWWTRTETQTAFCENVENIMGTGGRYMTANLEAFDKLAWTKEESVALSAGRQWVRELEEIPGSYYVTRSLDNAFRAVLYDGKNARETFERENANINREIARKRRELGLD